MDSFAKTYNSSSNIKIHIRQINVSKKRKVQSSNQLKYNFSSNINVLNFDNSVFNQTSIINNTENQINTLITNDSFSIILDLETATSMNPGAPMKKDNNEINNTKEGLPSKLMHKKRNSMIDQIKDNLWAVDLLEKIDRQDNNNDPFLKSIVCSCKSTFTLIV